MKVVKPDEEGLKLAATTMLTGGIVIYPTETFYGLGSVPSDPDATRRVCEIKGRADKPLPLICGDENMARRIVEFNVAAEVLAQRFWPGPLTLVLPKKIDYPIWVTHGKKTLAVRVPGHDVARRLASMSAGVIISTSANKSGEAPPRTAKEAMSQFGRTVDVVVDGGVTPGGLPSTVLDLTSGELWILRSGPVTGKQITDALKG
ncbi:threonylcarbamoyl-AMP synthase [Candidatus Bathyarchaeota archaeon]|nr:threonylcarbamoyl-AMP synthase [Candidatus Bathyarchaeota archaeon]